MIAAARLACLIVHDYGAGVAGLLVNLSILSDRRVYRSCYSLSSSQFSAHYFLRLIFTQQEQLTIPPAGRSIFFVLSKNQF